MLRDPPLRESSRDVPDAAVDGSAGAGPALRCRLDFLRELARRLRGAEPELVRLAEEEIGKGAFETLTSDLMPLWASIAWHRRHLRAVLGPRRIAGRAWWQFGQSHRVMRFPVGRVAIIATWNYPIQLLGIQVVQAIAAGNRVWVKPSERSPRTQAHLLRVVQASIDAAGLPVDTLTVCGATRDEGAELLRRERFDHILFTGSTSVGRAIAEVAARTLTPTTLELSGRDSAIVLEDGDPRLAARSIWHGVTLNAGQTCMAPRRALVHRSRYAEFLAALAPMVAAAGPLTLIDEAAARRAESLVRDAVAVGGRSLAGLIEPRRGATMRPVAVVDCPADAELLEGDHFGPVVAVTPFDDPAEALRLHRRGGQALATSVFTRRATLPEEFLARLGSGLVTLNDCILPSAHPAVALAGRGASGWGASRGTAGLVALTREVTVARTGRWRTPLEPPTELGMRWLRRCLGLPPALPQADQVRSPARGSEESIGSRNRRPGFPQAAALTKEPE